jgi:hypothetical protein
MSNNILTNVHGLESTPIILATSKKKKKKGKPLQMSYVVLIALKAFGWLVAKPPHKFWSLNIFIFYFFLQETFKIT